MPWLSSSSNSQRIYWWEKWSRWKRRATCQGWQYFSPSLEKKPQNLASNVGIFDILILGLNLVICSVLQGLLASVMMYLQFYLFIDSRVASHTQWTPHGCVKSQWHNFSFFLNQDLYVSNQKCKHNLTILYQCCRSWKRWVWQTSCFWWKHQKQWILLWTFQHTFAQYTKLAWITFGQTFNDTISIHTLQFTNKILLFHSFKRRNSHTKNQGDNKSKEHETLGKQFIHAGCWSFKLLDSAGCRF